MTDGIDLAGIDLAGIAAIGAIDTMIDFPHADMKAMYAFITDQTRDRESKEDFAFPAEYMFKDVPDKTLTASPDPVAVTVGEMDRWGVARGMIGVTGENSARALTEHPERFIPSTNVDPNLGMETVRRIKREHDRFDIRAVGMFPAGCSPQVPINDKRMYPVYATCVELGVAVFVCSGIPGPRLPGRCQSVELIDEVMTDFPELTFVTRHGCEPWPGLAIELMRAHPGLHYSTSAFAPRHYPPDIVEYANGDGADKVLYAGYFPMGLSLERIMTDMLGVPFVADVWPKFLRANAERILGLTP